MSATVRSQFINAYQELQFARKKYAGVTVEDPHSGRNLKPIETKAFIERIDDRFAQIHGTSPVTKNRMTDRLSSLFKKDDSDVVALQHLITDMETKKSNYEDSTLRRSKYGLLTPIAFCELDNLQTHLGKPKSERVFSLAWSPQFQQLSIEGATTGSLELVGISSQGLMAWWNNGQVNQFEQESHTWKDLQNLAFKQVYLLDSFHDKVVPSMKDIDSMDKLRKIIHELKKLTLTVIRLVFLRHEYFNNILPLFELLVPATYTLNVYIGLDHETLNNIGRQAIHLLETYISIILDLKETVAIHLDAVLELRRYEESDNSPLTITQPSPAAESAVKEPTRQTARSELFEDALRQLTDLGLTNVDIDLSSEGNDSWSGSFSIVRGYNAKHGMFQYAVKFLKPGIADSERIKKRLLREARAWKRLNHKNINTLIGFCVDPSRELPGLVSALCPFNLESYLRKFDGKISDKEKLEYLVGVAEGLNYMHSRDDPVIHGDLRPVILTQRSYVIPAESSLKSNVLLTLSELQFDINKPSYKAVLNDFGVSAIEEVDGPNEWTTKQRTNDYYLAPELLSRSFIPGVRQKRRVTAKGDIYAFGCMFYVVIYKDELFSYTEGKFMKAKRQGRFPAVQEKVGKEKHWEFLTDTWNPNVSQRISSGDVLSRVRSLCMEEHAL